MKVYEVGGEDRKVGALGVWQSFTVRVEAKGPKDATNKAREVRYAAGREHVHVYQVREVPGA